jgi:hypothetical protein
MLTRRFREQPVLKSLMGNGCSHIPTAAETSIRESNRIDEVLMRDTELRGSSGKVRTSAGCVHSAVQRILQVLHRHAQFTRRSDEHGFVCQGILAAELPVATGTTGVPAGTVICTIHQRTAVVPTWWEYCWFSPEGFEPGEPAPCVHPAVIIPATRMVAARIVMILIFFMRVTSDRHHW